MGDNKEDEVYIPWTGILLVCTIALLLAGFYYLGAYNSCEDGTLSGLKCVEPKVVSSCEDAGKYFIIPSIEEIVMDERYKSICRIALDSSDIREFADLYSEILSANLSEVTQ